MCVAGRRQEGTKNETGLDFSTRLALLSDCALCFTVPCIVGFIYLTAGTYKTGHQMSQEKDGSGSGEALEFPFLEISRTEMRDAHAGRMSCSSLRSGPLSKPLSLSPSPTLFLKASPDPSRHSCSLRSETLTNGVSPTDK